MTLSRKDFFRQSFISMGETLLKVGGNLREMQDLLYCAPSAVEPENEPVSGGNTMARVDNGVCLAKSCGCFSCVERCDVQAITVVVGEGIRVDEALCTGCGTCHYICPMTPKAVKLQARS